jgi:hypothetical protein
VFLFTFIMCHVITLSISLLLLLKPRQCHLCLVLPVSQPSAISGYVQYDRTDLEGLGSKPELPVMRLYSCIYQTSQLICSIVCVGGVGVCGGVDVCGCCVCMCEGCSVGVCGGDWVCMWVWVCACVCACVRACVR